MIKKEKAIKPYLGKKLRTIATFCLCATTLIGLTAGIATAVAKSPTEKLVPSKTDAMEKIVEATGGSDNVFLLFDSITRMPVKADIPIKINFQYAPTQAQKVVFEDAIQEFNEVFSVINNNYYFEINYTPTPNDLNSPYNINVSTTSDLNAGVLGKAHASIKNKTASIDGLEIYDKEIFLRDGLEQDVNASANVFRHEFFHLLGAGDAYKNENAPKDTVMQAVTGSDIHYSLTNLDVTILDALYRSPNNELSDEQIQDFTENYQERTFHTKAALNSKLTKMLLAQMDVNQLKDEIRQNYTNKSALEFANRLEEISIDEDFATEDIRFGQIQTSSPTFIAHYYAIENGDASCFYSSGSASFSKDNNEMTNADGILTSYNTAVVSIDGMIVSFEHDAGFTDLKLSGLYQQTDKSASSYFQSTLATEYELGL